MAAENERRHIKRSRPLPQKLRLCGLGNLPISTCRQGKTLPRLGPVGCIKEETRTAPHCLHGLVRVATHARATEKSIQRRFYLLPTDREIKNSAGAVRRQCGSSKGGLQHLFRRFSNGALRQDTFEADQCSIKLPAEFASLLSRIGCTSEQFFSGVSPIETFDLGIHDWISRL